MVYRFTFLGRVLSAAGGGLAPASFHSFLQTAPPFFLFPFLFSFLFLLSLHTTTRYSSGILAPFSSPLPRNAKYAEYRQERKVIIQKLEFKNQKASSICVSVRFLFLIPLSLSLPFLSPAGLPFYFEFLLLTFDF